MNAKLIKKTLNKITRTHTAFKSFDALLNAPGGYFPTLEVRNADRWILANEYDKAQAARHDTRRANIYKEPEPDVEIMEVTIA